MKQLWKEYTDAIETVDDKKLFRGESPVGRHTFFSLLNAATRQLKAKTCVSYYLEDANFCLTVFDEMLNRLQQLLPELLVSKKVAQGTTLDMASLTILSRRMKDAVCFGFYSHAKTNAVENGCDGVSMHCTRLGFSDCTKDHSATCDVCSSATVAPFKLVKLMNELMQARIDVDSGVRVAFPSRGERKGVYDELVSMKGALAIVSTRLKFYHAHVLRGRWQQDFISALIEDLIEGELVLIFDYMMKAGYQEVYNLLADSVFV